MNASPPESCPLRPRVCHNVAFPWVQCRWQDHPGIRAWKESEDDPRDFFEVFTFIRAKEYIAEKPGFSFFLRGHGEPPEHFPYRCLRSKPETEKENRP